MRSIELDRIALFAGCTRKDLQRVESLGAIIEVREGTALTIEGTFGAQAMVILDGHATVERGGVAIDRVVSGDVVGEIGVLDELDHRRRATVRAATDCVVMVFTRSEFLALVADVPRVAARIGTAAVRRLVAGLERSAVAA